VTVEAAKALDRRALKATRTGRDLAETSKFGGACETREGSLKKQVKGDGAVEILRDRVLTMMQGQALGRLKQAEHRRTRSRRGRDLEGWSYS
jgi:hypothetical protein